MRRSQTGIFLRARSFIFDRARSKFSPDRSIFLHSLAKKFRSENSELLEVDIKSRAKDIRALSNRNDREHFLEN